MVVMFVLLFIIMFYSSIICYGLCIIVESVVFDISIVSVFSIVGWMLKYCIDVVVKGFVRLYSVMLIEMVSEIVLWF